MISDKDDFRYQKGNGNEGRDGSSSSNPRGGKTEDENNVKKKRPRVGDSRINVNPRTNSGGYNNRDNRDNRDSGYNRDNRDSGYNRDNRDGGYNRDNRDSGYNRDNRDGGYNRDNRDSGYNRDNRDGGYNRDNRDSGYNRDNRDGGYNRDNRDGGYNRDNRDSGYNRDNRDGGYNRDNRDSGYNRDNRSRSYSNNRDNSNSGGGYNRNSNSNRGGYQKRDNGGGYGNRSNSGGGANKRYPSRSDASDSGVPRRTISKKKVLIKPVKYKENLDPNTPLRLNKYLANAGVCSRREADAYITSGIVKVNGVVVSELGAKVTRGDTVTFGERPVTLESKIYVLLNKPKNCVTTSDDPQNRRTVMDLVKNACTERIYPVGRLDRSTTGVLLLTNDGDLASKLMHPKFKKKKIYQVKLDKDVAIEDMQAIADGVELDDGEIHADSIAYVGEDVLNEIGIEIHSGRNRVVRRIFEKLGYQVEKLDRVYFAGLTKKNLARGRWRYLTEKEVNMLRMGAYE